jgi:Rieske 2Fe-2S family protein
VSLEIRGAGAGLERTLQRDFYFSEEIFARERERIFYREWFCVAREEQLPEAGDYLALNLAGESVLLVRNHDALAAFYNVCRHRGSQLVAEGSQGKFISGIRCPYHSWTYTLEGALRTAPFLDEEAGLTKGELSLHPIGVESWGGFIFLNLTPTAAAERDYPLARQLDAVPERLCRYPLAELRSARRIVYQVQANWKVMLENYNECYHCAPVHPELCRLVPAFRHRGGADLDWERGIPHREGAWTFTQSGTSIRSPFAGLNDDERVRHKGELIYPNLLLSLSAEHVAAFTVWPHGPEHRVRVPVSSSRNGQTGLRSRGRGGVLGPGQPAGLGHMRVGPAGHALPGVPVGLLRAHGERESGHTAVYQREVGRSGERET